MPLSITIYSHRARIRPERPRMSDRRAEYPSDYYATAEQPSYAPAPSSTVAPTQRDPYEQPQHPISYYFWATYASAESAPRGSSAGREPVSVGLLDQ